MLNERERGQLALIERDLCASDPVLAARFARLGRSGAVRTMRGSGPLPMLLLAGGLVLLLLGGVTAAVPVLVSGILMAVAALALAMVPPQPAQPGT
ncbi:MAG: DUF3040 domain-containing protein [Pseudonocardia sp.]|nr:DUF3040 domain-containing protein [Pseudonocardia sp.]